MLSRRQTDALWSFSQGCSSSKEQTKYRVNSADFLKWGWCTCQLSGINREIIYCSEMALQGRQWPEIDSSCCLKSGTLLTMKETKNITKVTNSTVWLKLHCKKSAWQKHVSRTSSFTKLRFLFKVVCHFISSYRESRTKTVSKYSNYVIELATHTIWLYIKGWVTECWVCPLKF